MDSKLLTGVGFLSIFCLVLSELNPAVQAMDIRTCTAVANGANSYKTGASNLSESYVKQLLDCLQIQQSALEETTLNLTSMIGHLKSTKKKRYIFHRFSLNWSEALESCEGDNQMLATIRSQHELDKYLQDMPKGYHISATYWIGGFDTTNRGKFVWLSRDGQVQETMSDLSWAIGQPRRTCDPGYDECVMSVYKKWRVVSCTPASSTRYLYISNQTSTINYQFNKNLPVCSLWNMASIRDSVELISSH